MRDDSEGDQSVEKRKEGRGPRKKNLSSVFQHLSYAESLTRRIVTKYSPEAANGLQTQGLLHSPYSTLALVFEGYCRIGMAPEKQVPSGSEPLRERLHHFTWA